jgi:hypothetical protein
MRRRRVTVSSWPVSTYSSTSHGVAVDDAQHLPGERPTAVGVDDGEAGGGHRMANARRTARRRITTTTKTSASHQSMSVSSR